MRSSSDRRIKEKLDEFIKKRNHLLAQGKPEDLKQFLKERGLPVPRNKTVLMLTWHKSITATKELPKEYRRASKQWLQVRGYHSLDDGDI